MGKPCRKRSCNSASWRWQAWSALPRQICFHAQQAAEKALKAVLLFHKIDFVWTHDITELTDIFEEAGITLPEDFQDAGELTPYAVESRYPVEEFINTLEESEQKKVPGKNTLFS